MSAEELRRVKDHHNTYYATRILGLVDPSVLSLPLSWVFLFNWVPLNLLSVGREVTDFRKNVRVPDWLPT